MSVRPATYDDIDRMQAIEVAAGQAFRALGMDAVAEDPPPSAIVLTGAIGRGHAWVRAIDDVVVADRLAAREDPAPPDRKQFIEECLAVGRQMLLQRRLHSTESVSSELFESALKLADNLGLLEPADEGGDLHARRRAFADELHTIGERITRAAALDPSHRLALP